MSKAPNILAIMTDQQRWDTIAALGNPDIYTPNFDRLVRRGLAFQRGYSSCPVCVPARYTLRTGCEPPRTGFYENCYPPHPEGHPEILGEGCRPYLAEEMKARGYRTFGIGKFHTAPVYEDLGYEVHLHAEELYGSWEVRMGDAYARFIHQEHPQYRHLELLHGERGDMYFVPQTSPLPAELTVEAWTADRAIEQIHTDDTRPYFGFVSFIGPHPPLAPPVPYNRLYDPDRMPDPVRGDLDVDHRDPFIPAHARQMFADDVSDHTWRQCRARYYGEITYIDACLGRILDAIEARPDADNTLICFFSDHGEMLGDHHACQKSQFFEEACHVPFLLSWPARLPHDQRLDEFACLTDLYGICTRASGEAILRDGHDILGACLGENPHRPRVLGFCGWPEKGDMRLMVREGDWKYIFIQAEGRELLFHLASDPRELVDRSTRNRDVADRLRRIGTEYLRQTQVHSALTDDGSDLRAYPMKSPWLGRVHQFDSSRHITGYPAHPADVLR